MTTQNRLSRSTAQLLVAMVTVWILTASLVPEAAAHHRTGTCGEVGIWEKAETSTNRVAADILETTIRVGHIPSYNNCNALVDADSDGVSDDLVVEYRSASQHNSMHARDGNPVDDNGLGCLETVAQRWSDGKIFMWGYGCGEPTVSPDNIHQINGYAPGEMYFWSASGGDDYWDLWYWRYDTSQWIYLGPVGPRPTKLRAWVESSGYNATSIRTTWVNGYTAWNEHGSWQPSFVCPEREDYDSHQRMERGYGPSAAVFNASSNSSDNC